VGTRVQTLPAQIDEKRDAALCNDSDIHSYAQAQGGFELFALVESNPEG
jgi:hypothetical protein